MRRNLLAWAGTVTLLLGLGGCGGGSGGGSPAPAPAPAPAPVLELAPQSGVPLAQAEQVFEVARSDWGGVGSSGDGGDGDGGVGGAAGDGAPLKKATVVVIDADGKTASGLTNDEGNYVVTFKNFRRPLVAKVVDAGGNVLAAVSNEAWPAGGLIRMNLNPLTDRIASQVLGTTTVVVSTSSGTSTSVVPVSGTDKVFTGANIKADGIAAATSDVVTSVRDALRQAGVDDANLAVFDPVRSRYKYDGTGVDAVIESLNHTRSALTGETLLSVKKAPLASDASGVATPTYVTAATPLAPAQLVTNTEAGLTFAKLTDWVAGVNRCLAMSPVTADGDPVCSGSNTIVSDDYKNHGRDFEEDFRQLMSGTNGTHIQGSSLRNPVLLFNLSSTGGATPDTAVVEVTIRQPGTGPLAGNIATPLEYTRVVVFRRFDTGLSSLAPARNWIAYGNQRDIHATVQTRYVRSVENNSARSANAAGSFPSSIQSRLHITVQRLRYDIATRTYVDAGLRAVRVTGPGLPSAGVVLVPSSVAGTNVLALHNKNGTIPPAGTTTSTSSNSFGLAAVALDGGPLLAGNFAFDPASALNASTAPDFSALGAYGRYKFEVFTTGNASNTTPDEVLNPYNIASVQAPAAMVTAAYNDLTPSAALVTPPSAGGTAITLNWQNNLNAAPVNSAQVVAQERNPKGAASGFTVNSVDYNTNVFAAYSVNNRPTSQVVNASVAAPVPSLTTSTGDFRLVAIWAYQGRANIQNLIRWDN